MFPSRNITQTRSPYHCLLWINAVPLTLLRGVPRPKVTFATGRSSTRVCSTPNAWNMGNVLCSSLGVYQLPPPRGASLSGNCATNTYFQRGVFVAGDRDASFRTKKYERGAEVPRSRVSSDCCTSGILMGCKPTGRAFTTVHSTVQ